MPADWTISAWPRCTHHAFLSHCAEDREKLVRPVDERLRNHRVASWIDERDYPPGRDPLEILREELLRCRHMVYFITAPFLKQGRAWTGIERGFAAIIQRRLWYGSFEVCHVELPLFFLPQDHVALSRSAYGPIRHKGLFYPAGRVDAGAVTWAAERILQFIRQEQRWATSIAADYERDPVMRTHFDREPNLVRRIKGTDLLPIP